VTDEIRLVHSQPQPTSHQGLPYFVGVSRTSAGASAISLNLIVVPPGGAARPHIHVGYETAIYQLSGQIETKYGPGLRESVISTAGDFLFIPAGLPHQPVNLSDTEPAMAVVARNDPEEQESVVLYDPEADASP
jgi:uncharacterized RmlC-like cupin family protein